MARKIVDDLISLVHLDIDAIHAYDQAIEKIEIQSIKNQLRIFREDHFRHANELSAEVKKMGGTPPEFKKDFKGFVLQGFTALRSVTGTEGALHAMETNEKLTNATYEKALSWDLPQGVRSIVERNREDERRHLEFIRRAIENRAWETPEAA